MDQICPIWIKCVQNGSNLSNMDQICPKWIKSIQNGSNLSKLAKTWLNCIFHLFQSEVMTLVRFSKYYLVSDVGLLWTDLEFSRINSAVCRGCMRIKMTLPFFIRLDQLCPKWIKSVQYGSNLSKMDQICPKWIKSVQNGSNLSKLAKTWLNCIFHLFQSEVMTLLRFSKYYLVSDVGLNQFSKHCSVPG